MPQAQGAGTVYAGGPGSSLRCPLYAKVQAGNSASFVEIVDASGNIVWSGGATIPTGHTLALTDANSLTENGIIVPQFIQKDFIQADATIPATQTIMVAMEKLQLVAASVRFSHAGGTSAALSLAKDPTGTAPGAGTGLLTATVDLTAAANQNYACALSGTVGNLQFAVGDGLSWVFSGTLTALTGLVLSCIFQRIP